MADSIVKLRVDGKNYDRQINAARQGLLAMEKACRSVGGTLEVVEKSELDFVKALGKMDTASMSSRVKMRELTNAVADMTGMYQRMTDEERSSDFGKAMAESINQLKSRAGDLKDQMDDLNEEIKHLASDTSFTDGINAMTSTIGSCASAMVAWSGDGKEMEKVIKELAKIQTTVNAVEALTKAFQKQNLVMLKNPYVLAATAIAAMGVAIYEYTTAESKAAAQIKLTDEQINQQVESLIKLHQYAEQASSAIGKLTKSQAEAQYQMALGDLSGAQSARRQLESFKANVQSAYNQAKKKYDQSAKTIVSPTTGTSITVYDNNAKADMERYEQQLKDIDKELEVLIAKQKEFDRAVSEANARRQAAVDDPVNTKKETAKKEKSQKERTPYQIQDYKDIGTLQDLANQKKYWQQQKMTGTLSVAQEAEQRIKEIEALEIKLRASIELPTAEELKEGLGATLGDFSKFVKENPIKLNENGAIKGMDKLTKHIGEATEAFGTMGSALQQIDDPTIQVAGIVMEAVANVAASFARALGKSKDPWEWIAAAASGTAVMISTIAAIKSATSGGEKGYADGGIITGGSFASDATLIRANAGEIVLNQAMTSNLAAGLTSAQANAGPLQAEVRGEQLRLVLNNHGRRTGRGEVTYSR